MTKHCILSLAPLVWLYAQGFSFLWSECSLVVEHFKADVRPKLRSSGLRSRSLSFLKSFLGHCFTWILALGLVEEAALEKINLPRVQQRLYSCWKWDWAMWSYVMISFFPQLCPNCHGFLQDRQENPAITISKETQVIKYESHEVPKAGSRESHGDIPPSPKVGSGESHEASKVGSGEYWEAGRGQPWMVLRFGIFWFWFWFVCLFFKSYLGTWAHKSSRRSSVCKRAKTELFPKAEIAVLHKVSTSRLLQWSVPSLSWRFPFLRSWTWPNLLLCWWTLSGVLSWWWRIFSLCPMVRTLQEYGIKS